MLRYRSSCSTSPKRKPINCCLPLDPLAALAEPDSSHITALLETVHTDDDAVRELLRHTAGESLWTRLYPGDPNEPSAQIDKASELQKKWSTEPGQMWRIGEHRLLCGDSTKPAHVLRLMADERAILFATDPPYAVGYTGGSHPRSWGNKGASNRDKDWSGQYVEAQVADVKNTEEAGFELYCGFIEMAIQHAIAPNAAWYCWYASRRHSMVERVWNKFDAFVHQQII